MSAFVAGDHAKPLIDYVGEKLRYVQSEKRWYVCNDKERSGYWAPEDRHQTMTYAKAYLFSVGEPVTRFNVDSVLYLARDIASATTDDFDADPWRMGLRNGVLDFRTGEVLPVSPDMLLTAQAGTAYDDSATCRRWEQHVLRLANGNTDTALWLQVAAGVTLLGHESSKPHIFPFLRGEGGNGKGTFIRALLAMFGEYGHSFPASELVIGEADRHMTTLASLKGKRFVAVEEVSHGKLNVARLKNLTGGDRLPARLIAGNLFTMPASWLMWLTSNRIPRFGAGEIGTALKRRFRPVITGPTLTATEYVSNWEEQLAEELPGIFNWALRGLGLWVSEIDRELPSPASMIEEAETIIEEQDLYAQWGDDDLDFNDPAAFTTSDDLIASLNLWRMRHTLKPLDESEWGDLWEYFGRIGLQRAKKRIGESSGDGRAQRRGWLGVRIKVKS